MGRPAQTLTAPAGGRCMEEETGAGRGRERQADRLDCALDLMRRMPPQNIEENLAGLLDIVPDLTEDLLSAVDQPLKVRRARVALGEMGL